MKPGKLFFGNCCIEYEQPSDLQFIIFLEGEFPKPQQLFFIGQNILRKTRAFGESLFRGYDVFKEPPKPVTYETILLPIDPNETKLEQKRNSRPRDSTCKIINFLSMKSENAIYATEKIRRFKTESIRKLSNFNVQSIMDKNPVPKQFKQHRILCFTFFKGYMDIISCL